VLASCRYDEARTIIFALFKVEFVCEFACCLLVFGVPVRQFPAAAAAALRRRGTESHAQTQKSR
jgi:hypothetical protein